MLASLALLGLGALIGLAYSHRVAAPIPSTPDYHLLTVDSGYVYSARFAPDDTAIVYGEARGGQPVALFSTRSDATVSRPLDLPAADVVGIADNGDMALILDRHHDGSWLRVGTLATVALAGGAPRALYENVYDADIAADGSALAVVRSDGVGQRLEYPIGTTIYRNEGWISSPRISHDGRRVAFADHPIGGDDIGYVTVVEPGKPLVRASGLLNF
ncbi:MAG: hypothetical protein K8J08_05580, partial [Thermoanaerobaculia bacterium]|nr:hypothetical protein [Thermoanaerobaculia bacterium]